MPVEICENFYFCLRASRALNVYRARGHKLAESDFFVILIFFNNIFLFSKQSKKYSYLQ